MTFTQFENKKIATYIQEGTSIPLVFLHGFCGDSSVWDDFIIPFSDQHIIRIDLPGFGNSEQIDQYSTSRFADVVHKVLDDHQIKECILIGHSMGGYVALEFAKKYSSFLRGLCLFHSHPYADTAEKIANRKKSIKFIKNNGSIYYVKQLIPLLFPKKYKTSNDLQVTKLILKASRYTPKNIIAGLEVMISRVDNTDVLGNAPFPVSFIIGKEDTIVPDYTIDTALPTIADIHLLKGVGHMGMLESQKKCVAIIKKFQVLCKTF